MVVITGATGLLGRELVAKLTSESIPCVGLRRSTSPTSQIDLITYQEADILDVASLTKAFAGASTVIHTAALVSFNPRRAKEIYQVNVEGTKNVVNACLALGVPNLIHISSVAALGREKNKVELDEEAKWVDSALNTDYAKSKYEAELEVYRGQEEGLRISIINPSVILARSDWAKSSSSIFKYVFEEHKFYTSGSFNYVDVRDVAEMVLRVYRSNRYGKRFIANAGSIASQQLFERIAVRLGNKPPSILANGLLISLATAAESVRALVTGKDPLVTKKTAQIASETFHYSSQKAMHELDMKFRTLEETLDWCCEFYLANYTTNKH